MPAGVALTSLLESAEADTFYDIFILHAPGCDFSGSALSRLPERYPNCRLTFRKVEGEFVGAYEIRGIPETAYYRLLAPEIIPEYDKILYSDVDVIIREDLARYYAVDLGDAYFGAVDNCGRFRPDVRKYVTQSLGLDWQKGYYYSGNLLINSAAIRRDGLLERFRALGTKAFKQQDMDIINIACNGRFREMGPAFCMTCQLYELLVGRRADMESVYGAAEVDHALSSGIVHYNGEKPWKGICLNMDIWWDCYRRSIFFDEAFCRDFWDGQHHRLERLGLMKRIKMVLRYPLDRKNA